MEEFFEYMIQKNIHVSDKACLYFKERLLELEQAHPSPARSQRVNVWLFTIGTSALNFEGEIFVEDDAMNTWLDRITGANGKLVEPFPPARIEGALLRRWEALLSRLSLVCVSWIY